MKTKPIIMGKNMLLHFKNRNANQSNFFLQKTLVLHINLSNVYKK